MVVRSPLAPTRLAPRERVQWGATRPVRCAIQRSSQSILTRSILDCETYGTSKRRPPEADFEAG